MKKRRLLSLAIQIVVIACLFGFWRIFSSDPNRFEEVYALALAAVSVGLLADKLKPEWSESNEKSSGDA